MEDQRQTSSARKKFIAIMAVIAAFMIGSWFVIDAMIGFDSFEGFPLGLVVILADLVAFVIIGVVLKKQTGA